MYGPEHRRLRAWLVDKRNSAGLTQRQLAERLEVVHSLVGKVESGERRLDVIEFELYCRGLETDPAEFFSAADEA